MHDPLTSIPAPYLPGREKKNGTSWRLSSCLPPTIKKNWQTSLLFWLRDIKQIAGLPYSPPSRTQCREPSSGCQTILFRRIVLRGFIVGRVILLLQRDYKVCETQLASWGCKTAYSAVSSEVHVNRTREVSESVPLLQRSCNRKGRASFATLLT